MNLLNNFVKDDCWRCEGFCFVLLLIVVVFLILIFIDGCVYIVVLLVFCLLFFFIWMDGWFLERWCFIGCFYFYRVLWVELIWIYCFVYFVNGLVLLKIFYLLDFFNFWILWWKKKNISCFFSLVFWEFLYICINGNFILWIKNFIKF